MPATRVITTGGPQSAAVLCITPAQPDAGLEVHDEAVVGGARARADVRERGAHARELAERHAELVDHLRAVRAEPAAAARARRPTTAGTSAAASASTGTCSSTVASRGSPIAPDRTVRASVAWPGSHRNSVPSRCTMPAARAAASTRRAFGGVAGERLLADHVLAGRDRREGELGVRVRRRRDRDRVDAVERERVVERRERERNAELPGALPRAVGVASDDRQHVETRPRAVRARA